MGQIANSKGTVVELVQSVLERAWGLPVVCPFISPKCVVCMGCCCTEVCKAMGMVFVNDEKGKGMASTEPAALTSDWELRLAEPLLNPACAYAGFLGGNSRRSSQKWTSIYFGVGVVNSERRCVAPSGHALRLPAGGSHEGHAQGCASRVRHISA